MSDIKQAMDALQVSVPRAPASKPDAAPRHRDHRAERLKQSDLDRQRKETIFRAIALAAQRGERCPTSDQFTDQFGIPLSSRLISALANEGRIRVEVSARNWRTVWICEGEHRGLHTRLPDMKTRAYMVVGPDRPVSRS